MDVAGKTVVITGGASGIGLATASASRLASSGARLVLGDIEEGPLKEAVAGLEAAGAEVVGVHCDVAKLQDVEALRDAALGAFGAVHVVFNNAGVGGGPTLGSPIEMWRWVSSVNLDGVVHGIHVFVPLLMDQDEGHVVNTASLAGLGGVPGMGLYCATKFAVVGLSESLFYDLAMRGSKVASRCCARVRADADRAVRSQHARRAADEDGEHEHRGAGGGRSVVAAGIDPAFVTDHVATPSTAPSSGSSRTATSPSARPSSASAGCAAVPRQASTSRRRRALDQRSMPRGAATVHAEDRRPRRAARSGRSCRPRSGRRRT